MVKNLSVSKLQCLAAAWSSSQDSFKISKCFFFPPCFFWPARLQNKPTSLLSFCVRYLLRKSSYKQTFGQCWKEEGNKKAREPTCRVTWRENEMFAHKRKRVHNNKCKVPTLLPRECWMTECSKADAHLLLKEALFHIVSYSRSNFAQLFLW